MKNIYLTGISGFVGSHLAKRLLGEGKNVIGLVHDIKPNSMLKILDIEDKIISIRGDVRNQKLHERVLTDYEIDTIFHLAAQSIVSKALKAPIPTYDINVNGTLALLEACRVVDMHTKIVVMSTDKVYGETEGAEESDRLKPTGPYETSKICVDSIAVSYAHTYDMNISVARPCNIYGFDLNRRIIPNVIQTILNGRRPIIFDEIGPDKSKREYIFIRDLIDALLTLRSDGEIWNIGSGQVINQEDLVLKILDLMGNPVKPKYVKRNKNLKEINRQYLGEHFASKIGGELGWYPKHSLEDGLRLTINAFKNYRERGVVKYE